MTKKPENPSIHLSSNAQGWSLIKDGIPLCAVTSKENAVKVAVQFKLELPSIYWDGEKGQFIQTF